MANNNLSNQFNLPKILIVDDKAANLQALKVLLRDIEVTIVEALSGNEALKKVKEHAEFALILTDVMMPNMNGYELISHIHSNKKTRHLPVIFLTAMAPNNTSIYKGYEAGGVDFIYKPLDKFILQSKVNVFLSLYKKQKQLEQEINERKKLECIIELNDEFPEIIGKSAVMKDLFSMINKVVKTDMTVLIQGESGTGKELIAKAIHERSARKHKPFIRFNCAALTESIIESELFGHEKGAFTGAEAQKAGRFELANEGTIFLDEVGELNLACQVKLLRVLQEKEFERVGGSKTINLDVRVITATNKSLDMLVSEKKFREDLYYRLNVFPITAPPLRNRKNDIELLANYFLDKLCKIHNIPIQGFEPEAIELLINYSWKGNVRELENIIARAIVLCDSNFITSKELPFNQDQISKFQKEFLDNSTTKILTEAEMVKIYAKEIYKKYGLKKTTAKVLGIDNKTLAHRLS